MGDAKRRKQLNQGMVGENKITPKYDVAIITNNYSPESIPEGIIAIWDKIREADSSSSYDIVQLVNGDHARYAIAHYYQISSKMYAEFIMQNQDKLSQTDTDTFSKILCKKKLKAAQVLILNTQL